MAGGVVVDGEGLQDEKAAPGVEVLGEAVQDKDEGGEGKGFCTKHMDSPRPVAENM
jgi:hypothetical protein